MYPFLIPILLLLTAACQPMPPPMPLQPTAEEKTLATVLLPQDSQGVWVLEIRDLPLSLSIPLRTMIVRTLQDEDIPAAVRDTAHSGILLRGQAQITPLPSQEAEVEVTWFLTSAKNEVLHSFNQRYLLPWDQVQAPDTRTLDRMARAVAPPLLSRLSAPARAENHLHGIVIGEISGAPGDGRVALKHSLEFLFKENGIPVVDEGGANRLTVTAEVHLDAPVGDRQRIRLRWRLTLPDGTEFGTVDQENQIPAGSLDKTWGETAFFSAEGAFEGLAALLAKAPFF